KKSPLKLKIPLIAWAFQKPSVNSWPVLQPNTRAKPSTTKCAKTSPKSASSSLTWTPPSASIQTSSRNTSVPSFPIPTTNSQPSTVLSGAVVVSSTSPQACVLRSLYRHTSASTPRTWASLSVH